tara:strand:- start:265 stop:2475 length:2211 start_codon:yes stop_codon:yes gene_type:complete
MKIMKYIIAVFLSIAFSNNLNSEDYTSDAIEINIIEQNKNYIIINYTLNSYSINDIDYNNELYQSITVDGEPNFIIQNAPSLPHINRSIIIPDNFSSAITILNSEYTELNGMNIIPSKGNITRNFDLNTIPYVKGDVYSSSQFFPQGIAELHDPYILRDYRGQVVQVNPFLFNPEDNLLRVYTSITLRIDFNGLNSINIYEDRNQSKNIVYDFDNLYQDHFINYATYQNRYTPLAEDGEMLVICYDSFCDEVQEFVDWKNQKGIKTTLVPKSEAGSNVSSIKSYISSFYNSHDLTYVLLVGDKNQIPSQQTGSGSSSGASDVYYAYISGNDSYPEFFIGRFSAQNTGHINTQVERSIEYERNPQLNGDWYTNGLLVASNEGAGAGHDGGESDWQHAHNMWSDLVDYNYTYVDEMYDGSHSGEDNSGNPSDTMVKNAINSGLGIIHYTGHGDTDVWVTSNFNNGDVNALTNNNELPFICTVGCKSGDFSGTCLGEVFTYATNNNEPTGAIATFMSTIYQAWAPPMEAQDEMVDILVENYSNNRKYSFGGISWNGCLKMNDAYGSAGYDETDHWTLFGDPSISLRTDTPYILNVNHSGSLNPSDGAYEVIVDSGYDNILAALSSNGNLLGAAYASNGVAIIELDESLDAYDSIILTVTGYNTTTVIETVAIGDSCVGYIEGDINGDSVNNILDIVTLVNFVLGTETADNCQLEFGDINQDGILNILDIIQVVNIILGN